PTMATQLLVLRPCFSPLFCSSTRLTDSSTLLHPSNTRLASFSSPGLYNNHKRNSASAVAAGRSVHSKVGLSTSRWSSASGSLTGKFQAWHMHQKLGVRNCFHPGASAISRDYVGIVAKEVTGREMLAALSAYVWPK
ncbi:hypothetical protein OTU49_007331, partial [Cherax quadricarinatus]